MAIAIKIGVTRKESTGDFGSLGAECEFSGIEVPAGATAEEIARLRDYWFGLCETAVAAELARQRADRRPAAGPPANGHAPAPAPPARESAPPPHKERSEWGTADRGEAAWRRPPGGGGGNGGHDGPPRSGKALLARLKDLDEAHGYNLFGFVRAWAKRNGNTDKLVDWDGDWVKGGWDQAERRMVSLRESEEFQRAN